MENYYINELNKSPLGITDIPRPMKMVALRGLTVFPYTVRNIELARDKSILAVTKSLECNENIFLVAQKSAGIANPAPKDIHRVGTVCRVRNLAKIGEDIYRINVEGLYRAEIDSYISILPFFEVTLRARVNDAADTPEILSYCRSIKTATAEYFTLDSKISADVRDMDIETDPERYSFILGAQIINKEDQKQNYLALPTLDKRLESLLMITLRETEIIKVEKKISAKVRKQLDKNQKEYYLREQVKAIHEELGDGEDDLQEYLKTAERLQLPEEPMQKIQKEVKRLGKMSPTSPEAGVSRTYIEWILDLPWTEVTKDNTDLTVARQILDEDHYGLKKVKERILEYLAVLQLTGTSKGPILCFVGPPGVGKTSIVRWIARTLGRKFVNMSLGGVRDEAEIRGHRRTYIGAIPGRIIYHIKQAGSVNPVFLLDEIDKMSSDYRGDPASAMLEVLDPEQNFQYRDHYLEVPYNLSKVLFVTTANTVETIPPPLLDRMEIIELSGYTGFEKLNIAKKYLIPKQLLQHGMKDFRLIMPDETILALVEKYTRESGVRSLEREIANICRKIALLRAEKHLDIEETEIIPNSLHDYVGVPKYTVNVMNEADEVGASTGLAWTSAGGKTMNIEVTLLPGGKGEISLTGQLGDVMKESAHTAISLIRSRSEKYGIDTEAFSKNDIHLHVPEGAVPKDGPSAGVAIATAILSAFSKKPVSRNVAMTGEITLRGKVLPIGGLKEKMLAAHRAGIKNIIIPQQNVKDLEEIPQDIRDGLNIISVSDIDAVFQNAIV